MKKFFSVFAIILSFSALATADEIVNLKGTLAIAHCKDSNSPQCVLLNADRVPFQIVLKPAGEELEGAFQFKSSLEDRRFTATVLIIKYKNFDGKYFYNIDLFTEAWVEGNDETLEKNYLGYFIVKSFENFPELGLWGRRVGKESDFYVPFVLLEGKD
jgi:hypothetical protein